MARLVCQSGRRNNSPVGDEEGVNIRQLGRRGVEREAIVENADAVTLTITASAGDGTNSRVPFDDCSGGIVNGHDFS